MQLKDLKNSDMRNQFISLYRDWELDFENEKFGIRFWKYETDRGEVIYAEERYITVLDYKNMVDGKWNIENKAIWSLYNYYLVTDGYQKPFMAYRVSKTELLKWIQDCRKGGNGKN